MFKYVHVEDIFRSVPIVQILLTVGLFVAAAIVSRVIKRSIRKAAEKKVVDEGSFWAQFWKSEHGLIFKSISWIVWLGFVAGAILIWSKYISKVFIRLEQFYAPVVYAVVIILITVIALKASQHLIRIVIEHVAPIAESATARGKQRVHTLQHVFSYGSTIIIVLVATLMLLDNFGIDLKAVLATLGVASLAVGFGAQSLVKDIFSGIFIIIEDQFAVGDVAMINKEGGLVERMTLRITQLRNTEGTLITIPNGSIEMVKNLTSEWSRVDYMIGVAYATDLDHAMKVVMDEAGRLKGEWPQEIIEEPELMGVDEFGDSSITLRVWIKTRPLMQWKVKRELNRRIHKRFEKEGIEIPFPQRTLWIKEPGEEALLAALSEKKPTG